MLKFKSFNKFRTGAVAAIMLSLAGCATPKGGIFEVEFDNGTVVQLSVEKPDPTETAPEKDQNQT